MRVVYLLGKDNNPDVINMTLEIVRKTEKSVFDIVGVFAAKPLSDAETDMPLNKSELCCYNPFELVRFRSFLVKIKSISFMYNILLMLSSLNWHHGVCR